MTKRIRQQAPDGAQCYIRRWGLYLRVGDDGLVSKWTGHAWVVVPGLVEDDLLVVNGIIWLDGRGYRLLWVTVFVLVLGVACMVVLR